MTAPEYVAQLVTLTDRLYSGEIDYIAHGRANQVVWDQIQADGLDDEVLALMRNRLLAEVKP